MSPQPKFAIGIGQEYASDLPIALWSRRWLVGGLAALVAIGATTFAASLGTSLADRAWQSFLVNLLFWMGIAQGGIVVSAALYLTQARWGGSAIYRLAEAFAPFISIGFILFWAIFFGRAALFPWVNHPEPEKASWLNAPFLFARDGISLAVITALSMWLIGASRRPETVRWAQHPDNIELPPALVRRLAPALAMVYAAVYSLIGFDLVMSLAPRWHSTLFGAYFFEGAFWSAIAAIALLTASIGPLLEANNRFSDPKLRHDLGKFLFAFSVFWAYLLFAQYLPIWYADLPLETFFVVLRAHFLPWSVLSWTVFALVWGIPFVVLMGRRPKRAPAILGSVALLGLIGIYLERYVLIVPSLSPHVIPFGWVEALITLGFFGLFALCSLSGLEQAVAAAIAEADGDER